MVTDTYTERDQASSAMERKLARRVRRCITRRSWTRRRRAVVALLEQLDREQKAYMDASTGRYAATTSA